MISGFANQLTVKRMSLYYMAGSWKVFRVRSIFVGLRQGS